MKKIHFSMTGEQMSAAIQRAIAFAKTSCAEISCEEGNAGTDKESLCSGCPLRPLSEFADDAYRSKPI